METVITIVAIPKDEAEAPAPSFTPIGIKKEEVNKRSRSTGTDHFLIYTSRAGFRAFLPNSVLQRAMTMAERAAPNEFISLLAGQVFSDKDGQDAVVYGLVSDEAAQSSPGTVNTTADSEYSARTLLEVMFPDCIPIGWCHSHVGIGAFFSSTDRHNQATWTKPYHLGMVVDAVRREVAVFHGPRADKLRLLTCADIDSSEDEPILLTKRKPVQHLLPRARTIRHIPYAKRKEEELNLPPLTLMGSISSKLSRVVCTFFSLPVIVPLLLSLQAVLLFLMAYQR